MKKKIVVRDADHVVLWVGSYLSQIPDEFLVAGNTVVDNIGEDAVPQHNSETQYLTYEDGVFTIHDKE